MSTNPFANNFIDSGGNGRGGSGGKGKGGGGREGGHSYHQNLHAPNNHTFHRNKNGGNSGNHGQNQAREKKGGVHNAQSSNLLAQLLQGSGPNQSIQQSPPRQQPGIFSQQATVSFQHSRQNNKLQQEVVRSQGNQFMSQSSKFASSNPFASSQSQGGGGLFNPGTTQNPSINQQMDTFQPRSSTFFSGNTLISAIKEDFKSHEGKPLLTNPSLGDAVSYLMQPKSNNNTSQNITYASKFTQGPTQIKIDLGGAIDKEDTNEREDLDSCLPDDVFIESKDSLTANDSNLAAWLAESSLNNLAEDLLPENPYSFLENKGLTFGRLPEIPPLM